MVKGTVKTNKANDTKYIYLAKNCGFNDGQEVDVSFSGIGIYNKENLESILKKIKKCLLILKIELEEFLDYELTTENSSIEFTGSKFGESFYKQLLFAILISFLLMALVVLYF